MPGPSWSEQQKAEALALAHATSIREAARQTGIPAGTLARWSASLSKAEGRNETRITAVKVAAMGDQIRENIIDEATKAVAGQITERLTAMAEDLYQLATKAKAKVDRAISDKGEVPGATGKADPQWVRALVGVMAQSIEKAQLLAGRPTGRASIEGTMTQRQEYEVTHILQDPDSLQLARTLFRRGLAQDEAGAVAGSVAPAPSPHGPLDDEEEEASPPAWPELAFAKLEKGPEDGVDK